MSLRFIGAIAGVLLVFALVPVACGGGDSTSEPATGPGAEPSATQPAAAPTSRPTDTPPPATATAQATLTPPPALSDEQLDRLQEDYLTLVMLESSAVMLEETAQQVQLGKLAALEAWGQLIAIGAILGGVEEALAESPSLAVLQPAWDQAQAALPLVGDVLGRWLNEEIAAADVTIELTAAREQIDRALERAETALAQQVGGSFQELRELRQRAMTELRVALATTPTPDPASMPEIEIVDIRWYKDILGYLNFIGELRNVGTAPASSAEVNVSLLSADGAIVATKSGSSLLGLLPPGANMPFRVSFFEDPGAFDKFEAVAQADRAGSYTLGSTHRAFEASRERVKPADEGRYALVIEAANAGSEPANLIEVAVTAYDAEGNVAGVGDAYAEQELALPGDVVTFNVEFSTTAQPVSHVVMFEGDIADADDYVQALEVTSLSSYEGYFGDLTYVGEVANLSEESVSQVDVVVTVSDADGNLLASESSNTYLEVVPPGASAPFSIDMSESFAGEISVAAHVVARKAESYILSSNYKQFELVQQNRKAVDTGRFAVVGQIKNIGDKPAEYAEIIVTAYDAAGEVVGVGRRYAGLDTIAPDMVSPFEVEFAVAGDVADFKVQVEGRVAD